MLKNNFVNVINKVIFRICIRLELLNTPRMYLCGPVPHAGVEFEVAHLDWAGAGDAVESYQHWPQACLECPYPIGGFNLVVRWGGKSFNEIVSWPQFSTQTITMASGSVGSLPNKTKILMMI